MPKIKLKFCNIGNHYTYPSRFGIRKKSPDGLQYRCKECWQKKKKEDRKNNPEKAKQEDLNRYWNHLEYHQGYREANKENQIAYHKEWYIKNKDKKDAQNKAWFDSNPDLWVVYRSRRRALKAAIPETFPENWWQQMIIFYGPYCSNPNCTREISKKNPLSHDHIIPISDQERSSNSLLNSQILCKGCNSSKSASHQTDYRDWTKGILLDDLTIIYDKIEPTSENLFKLQESNETISTAQ